MTYDFTHTVTEVLRAEHRQIKAGRPESNDYCASERVRKNHDPRQVLEAGLRPLLIPKQTGLRPELDDYVHLDNTDRAHTGYRNKGRTPDEVMGKARCTGKP